MGTWREISSLVWVGFSGGYHHSRLLLQLVPIVWRIARWTRSSQFFHHYHSRVWSKSCRWLVFHGFLHFVGLRTGALCTQNSFLFVPSLLVPDSGGGRPAQNGSRFRSIHRRSRRLAPQIWYTFGPAFLAKCGSRNDSWSFHIDICADRVIIGWTWLKLYSFQLAPRLSTDWSLCRCKDYFNTRCISNLLFCYSIVVWRTWRLYELFVTSSCGTSSHPYGGPWSIFL